MNTVRKTVGVCLAQAHTSLKTELLSEMDRAARGHGFSVTAFNCSLDYYTSQRGDHITACVYDLVRFDELSALVILHDNIYDAHLVDCLVQDAQKEGVPVFYLGGTRDDCVCITDDYEAPYKELVRHVIRDHGVKDTFYLDNVAAEIAGNLITVREHMPGAILCANDSMASAVCGELQKHGLRVPEDVIVTGFDGTPAAYLGSPQLTTCHSNPAELADLVMDLAERFRRGEEPIPTFIKTS